jgi:hypothetical protein
MGGSGASTGLSSTTSEGKRKLCGSGSISESEDGCANPTKLSLLCGARPPADDGEKKDDDISSLGHTADSPGNPNKPGFGHSGRTDAAIDDESPCSHWPPRSVGRGVAAVASGLPNRS